MKFSDEPKQLAELHSSLSIRNREANRMKKQNVSHKFIQIKSQKNS